MISSKFQNQLLIKTLRLLIHDRTLVKKTGAIVVFHTTL